MSETQRSQPRRLRELSRQQPAPLKRVRRGTRPLYLLLGGVLLVVVGVLGYGLVEHSLVRHRVDATIERTDLYVKAGEHIQVNVVNACGADGMAMKFTEFLRARKFDVPEYSTLKTHEPYSKVIDRVGDPISSQKVAYALGIPQERIETEIDSSLYLRATVIIGDDYRTLRPMK